MVENNEKKLNDLFSQAKVEPVHTSFEDTKKNFTSSVHSSVGFSKKRSLFNLKNGIMITLISALAIVTIVQVNQNQVVSENEIETVIQLDQVNEELSDNTFNTMNNSSIELNEDKLKNKTSQKKKPIEIKIEKKSSAVKEESLFSEIKKETPNYETVYRFPILTPKEEIENQKRKRRMMKNLVKFNKKEYSFVPSGSLITEDGEKSINSFYIGSAEVTNIQYRTFLMDLVQMGQKEKYSVASPQLDVWTNEGETTTGEPLNKVYFSHPAYDDYPVVGISQKGAELYCEWLTQEVIAYYPKNRYEDTWIKVRIPSDVEWMYVANEGGGEIKHQWSSEGLQNEAGCYLANFKQEIADDGAVYTAKTKTYLPNKFGVYNLFGNVAELVYYLPNNAIGVKGGGWQSNIDALDIDYKDPNKGNVKPSSNVGFRVVISFVKK